MNEKSFGVGSKMILALATGGLLMLVGVPDAAGQKGGGPPSPPATVPPKVPQVPQPAPTARTCGADEVLCYASGGQAPADTRLPLSGPVSCVRKAAPLFGCGTCRLSNLANASGARCDNGALAFTCNAGYADADGDRSNGCEQKIAERPATVAGAFTVSVTSLQADLSLEVVSARTRGGSINSSVCRIHGVLDHPLLNGDPRALVFVTPSHRGDARASVHYVNGKWEVWAGFEIHDGNVRSAEKDAWDKALTHCKLKLEPASLQVLVMKR
jgi:hypothetical protein